MSLPPARVLWAREFYRAANHSRSEDKKFSPVQYFLYGRALELVLKSFLLAKGWQQEKLKSRIYHDLMKALNKAKAEGLESYASVSESEVAEVKKANRYYKSKGFEYFEVLPAMTGYPDLPDLEQLDNLVSHLVEALKDLCLNAT